MRCEKSLACGTSGSGFLTAGVKTKHININNIGKNGPDGAFFGAMHDVAPTHKQLEVTEMKRLNAWGKTSVRAASLALMGWVLTSCAVLPSSTSENQKRWAEYAQVKGAYDAVVEKHTSHDALRALGFNPVEMPNVQVLSYVDVVNLFGSAFKLEDLPEGIRACVAATDRCIGYVMKISNIKNKRVGNIPADLFGFRKHTRTSGWEAQATLVLVNDVVVYKLWKGTPMIENTEKQSNPLGPMQNLSGLLKF